jgi:indole-3-glycerol phosphate synthase
VDSLQPVASGFLTRILADKLREIAVRRSQTPEAELRRQCQNAAPAISVLEALGGRRTSVIAEVKRRSPSAGTFNLSLDAAEQAATYAAAGAVAISVLTDAPYFGGSLDDLRLVRSCVSLPLLRKDFIVDPYQLLEARAAGADLVLLIVAALTPARLGSLLEETYQLGMTAMVEIHTPAEAAIATASMAKFVGINNRNLQTFEVDLSTTQRLRPLLPGSTRVAALSGIRTVDDARQMREAGADAVLIGEALVRAKDPASLIAAIGRIT